MDLADDERGRSIDPGVDGPEPCGGLGDDPIDVIGIADVRGEPDRCSCASEATLLGNGVHVIGGLCHSAAFTLTDPVPGFQWLTRSKVCRSVSLVMSGSRVRSPWWEPGAIRKRHESSVLT
jgi:hypothetical protein